LNSINRLVFTIERKFVFYEIGIGFKNILLFILTANGLLPGGSGTTIRHNTQITHTPQNNTSHSNKTQHTKLHKQ
jgi:hypothetical protein